MPGKFSRFTQSVKACAASTSSFFRRHSTRPELDPSGAMQKRLDL